ncbi:hypothetical protein N8639_01805 [bacterium]|jgi:hypothetical protein|nr:hypothetical protein [bacterium]MDB4640387.1 hypothetical protein [Pirellulaceae bacterium]MDB4650792.1 hypothetical protein [Pirellulaceae bacterium]
MNSFCVVKNLDVFADAQSGLFDGFVLFEFGPFVFELAEESVSTSVVVIASCSAHCTSHVPGLWSSKSAELRRLCIGNRGYCD